MQLTPISCTQDKSTIENIIDSNEGIKRSLHDFNPNAPRGKLFSLMIIFFPQHKNNYFLRIMKDYCEFPPIKYFMRVLKTCPKAAYLYVQLWEKKDHYNAVLIEKKYVRKEFLLSPTVFRNLLSSLMFLNLLCFGEYGEYDHNFSIAVFGMDESEE